MNIDRIRIAVIASKAEQDMWQWRAEDPDVLEGVNRAQIIMHPDMHASDGLEPCLVASVSNRDHIAAASPPVVLALLAHIDRLEAMVKDAASTLEANTDKAFRKHVAAGLREDLAKGTYLL